MITFFAVNICLVIYCYCNNKKTLAFYTYVNITAFIMLALFMLENVGVSSNILRSDEIYYYELAKTGFTYQDEGDRYLWVLLNNLIINYDVDAAGWALKIINIPIYIISILTLRKLMDYDDRIYWLFCLMPYYLWMSTFDFRDTLIITITFIVFLTVKQNKNILITMLYLLMLYLLRPFAALVALILICVSIVFRKNNYKYSLAKKLIYMLVVVVLLLMFVSNESVVGKLLSYFSWFQYTTGDGADAYAESMDMDNSNPLSIKGFAISCARYIFTPIPTSLLMRILSGGTELWGLMDDIIRFVHQTLYYAISLYLLFHFKIAFNAFKKTDMAIKLTIISLASYAPIYSFHLFGITHSRSKVPFQIAVFMLAVLVIRYSKFDNKQMQARLTLSKI